MDLCCMKCYTRMRGYKQKCSSDTLSVEQSALFCLSAKASFPFPVNEVQNPKSLLSV